MRRLSVISEWLAVVLLLSVAPIRGSAAQISTFPVPDHENSWAFGVNDKGYVVGAAGDSLDLGHATGVLYGKGHVTWLGSSFFYDGGPDREYGVFTFATAINNAGLIVGGEVHFGDTHDGFYTYQSAFLFNGNLNSIPVGDPNNTATAINNKGQIVGHYDDFYGGGFRVIGPERGYSIDAGQAIDIAPPNHDSDSTYLSSINDIGQIVGVTTATPSPVAHPRPGDGASTSSATSDLPFAFLYANGTYTDLGSLGGGGSDPGDINNEGKIVGYSYLSNGA
jgi:probable HAF family extracellular repeat protein